jgi:hypothetical protein
MKTKQLKSIIDFKIQNRFIFFPELSNMRFGFPSPPPPTVSGE